MKTFKELREKTLTPAEKKKREEIAKAMEKDSPDMPMDKKMAIATATAKRVAEYGGPKISRAEYLKKGKEYHAEAFEPHMMYDPETGKSEKAEKPEDHERLKKKGYTHEKPQVEEGAENYTVKKGAYTRKVDGKTADKMKRQGWKLVAREKVEEARKDASADLYFDTYSAAVQHARKQAEKKGFEVVEDDWFQQVTTGKGKPGRGKTTRHTLKLTKNGKPVRQGLSIQVYNRDTNKNTYELNFYVS